MVGSLLVHILEDSLKIGALHCAQIDQHGTFIFIDTLRYRLEQIGGSPVIWSSEK
jgi:hypothetical protein